MSGIPRVIKLFSYVSVRLRCVAFRLQGEILITRAQDGSFISALFFIVQEENTMNVFEIPFVSVAATIAAISVSVFSLTPGKTAPRGYWQDASTYVYYTLESATYCGESDGVATFETSDGNVWECFVIDPDIQDGERVTLTFENRETREEYVRAEEYGIESATRTDNGRIIAID